MRHRIFALVLALLALLGAGVGGALGKGRKNGTVYEAP
jgi:hypothetical protein